ncbi:hypothetical protein PRIPAC_89431 [Pristionchus pacificus]|uniref:Uncharacterized protein n=1 Tax=Pristionchus pacificus TaxID=54126 RepID=A0A2A6CY48_PRIPA|nr:hypothetical protein PRIPAC_89431 [Pristionchus pacificus]|eukprot:PDM83089.1 hypothetical protein PRIPAC_37482 [Pristionchus pacificus]
MLTKLLTCSGARYSNEHTGFLDIVSSPFSVFLSVAMPRPHSFTNLKTIRRSLGPRSAKPNDTRVVQLGHETNLLDDPVHRLSAAVVLSNMNIGSLAIDSYPLHSVSASVKSIQCLEHKFALSKRILDLVQILIMLTNPSGNCAEMSRHLILLSIKVIMPLKTPHLCIRTATRPSFSPVNRLLVYLPISLEVYPIFMYCCFAEFLGSEPVRQSLTIF